MSEENQVSHVLRADLKKKVQAVFALGIQDDVYQVAKITKSRFTYTSKYRFVTPLKPIKRSISISVDNKLSIDYLINKLIDVEKRLAFSEYKQSTDKKKINKIMDDLYEPSVEPNAEQMTLYALNLN
jgi:hypothetical protein